MRLGQLSVWLWISKRSTETFLFWPQKVKFREEKTPIKRPEQIHCSGNILRVMSLHCVPGLTPGILEFQPVPRFMAGTETPSCCSMMEILNEDWTQFPGVLVWDLLQSHCVLVQQLIPTACGIWDKNWSGIFHAEANINIFGGKKSPHVVQGWSLSGWCWHKPWYVLLHDFIQGK